MRKLIAYEFLSLDGLMAGKEGQEMDFVLNNFIQEMTDDIAEEYNHIDTFLFGRITYESLAGYWPNKSVEDEPLADYMNKINKTVFSKTLKKANWNNSRIAESDIIKEVEEMKRLKGKNIMIIGSASIIQTLTTHGLIDEYKFLLFPTVLGEGKPLFTDISSEIQLKLINSIVFRNGVIKLIYNFQRHNNDR